MDEEPRRSLFDPAAAHRLVLARRPVPASAVTGVVSDAVWHDVVRLLRWATADTHGATDLDTVRWWRLASGCADLLRRLPGLVDELDEPWASLPVEAPADPALDALARLDRVAERLTALLRSAGPVPLQRLAVEIDALGAAAIGALAERGPWATPGAPS